MAARRLHPRTRVFLLALTAWLLACAAFVAFWYCRGTVLGPREFGIQFKRVSWLFDLLFLLGPVAMLILGLNALRKNTNGPPQ